MLRTNLYKNTFKSTLQRSVSSICLLVTAGDGGTITSKKQIVDHQSARGFSFRSLHAHMTRAYYRQHNALNFT